MVTSVLFDMQQKHMGNQQIFPLTPVRSINFRNSDKCLQNSKARQKKSSQMLEKAKEYMLWGNELSLKNKLHWRNSLYYC